MTRRENFHFSSEREERPSETTNDDDDEHRKLLYLPTTTYSQAKLFSAVCIQASTLSTRSLSIIITKKLHPTAHINVVVSLLRSHSALCSSSSLLVSIYSFSQHFASPLFARFRYVVVVVSKYLNKLWSGNHYCKTVRRSEKGEEEDRREKEL